MIIVFDGMALIGLAIFLLYVVLFIVPMWIKSGVDRFKEWRATGYCKHEWELYSTHSFGNHADYKCKHCGIKRIRRM